MSAFFSLCNIRKYVLKSSPYKYEFLIEMTQQWFIYITYTGTRSFLQWALSKSQSME